LRIKTTEILPKDFKYMLFVRVTKEKYTQCSKDKPKGKMKQGILDADHSRMKRGGEISKRGFNKKSL